MSYTYHIDPELFVAQLELAGKLDNVELDHLITTVVQHPHYQSAMKCLIDLRHIENLDITGAGIQEIANYVRVQSQHQGGRGATALVAPQNIGYGFLRMYQLHSEPAVNVEVFHDFTDAWLWLGLPEKYCPR